MKTGPECKYKSETHFKQIIKDKLGTDLGEIKYNSGITAISKLCLNNLKNQFVDNSNSTNICIAAFTTSHAQMMLYGILDKLGDQVLGFDMDPVWHIDRSGGVTIQTGNMLGELTDELDDR